MKKLLLLGMALFCVLNSSLITAMWIPSAEDEDFYMVDSDSDSDEEALSAELEDIKEHKKELEKEERSPEFWETPLFYGED